MKNALRIDSEERDINEVSSVDESEGMLCKYIQTSTQSVLRILILRVTMSSYPNRDSSVKERFQICLCTF